MHSTANKAIAVMHFKILDFTVPPFVRLGKLGEFAVRCGFHLLPLESNDIPLQPIRA